MTESPGRWLISPWNDLPIDSNNATYSMFGILAMSDNIDTLEGNATLFDEWGSYICDARYQIQIWESSSGRQESTGTVYDIEYGTLIQLPGRYLVLRREDGTSWEIVMEGLQGQPPSRCDIRVNTEIEMSVMSETSDPAEVQSGGVTRVDTEERFDRLWQFYSHADNLHAGRINFFLVIETVLIAGFLQVSDPTQVQHLIAAAGVLLAATWFWVNHNLQRRMNILNNQMEKLDPDYLAYLNCAPGPPSSWFLTYLLPPATGVLWFFLLWTVAGMPPNEALHIATVPVLALAFLVLLVWLLLERWKWIARQSNKQNARDDD